MNESLLLTPVAKKRRKRIFKQRKYPFPIFSNKSQQTEGANSGAKFKCFIGYLENNCVIVRDRETIKKLFTMGFFGKGTLSRSTPQVCFEQPKNTVGANSKEDSIEDTSDSESSEDSEVQSKKDESSKNESDTNETNKDIFIEEGDEEFQLTFEEAFFLSYALGCLVVMDEDQPMDLIKLWQKFCDAMPDMRFPIMYTAYHHFRSKGWVVRSGLKYGTDYVLYKEGPPFYHSTYAVIVKDIKEKHLKDTHHNDRVELTWASLSAANRVVTHSNKGLMILYVMKPDHMSENKVLTPFCISTFNLQEVLVKRWVPSAEREDDEENT